MKFTQLEIIELKKICVTENVPMSFKLDGDSIDYDFANNKSIQSILKKDKNGYSIDAMNSNGASYHVVQEKFDVFKVAVRNWIRAIKRDNPYEIEKKKNIDYLSPKFYNVFQEAHIIEELGFHESAGMIYRKSLEFVVKDFLSKLLPRFQKIISQKTIGQIIFHFYKIEKDELVINSLPDLDNEVDELNTIKLLAKKIRNTFKIGNDFSHYERKLMDLTSKDMKSNIEQIVEFIDFLLEERKLQAQRKELDNEFESEKFI
ncbi:hypothetical protein [Carboxylicivirga marina]|uniref:hypothetical protein n=1 Tax=Carboxylicivirga marina TaxID=2800988 RepID=UPI002599E646|nr:hypothetical protein [uncultured Carboxylicivirga sp.]